MRTRACEKRESGKQPLSCIAASILEIVQIEEIKVYIHPLDLKESYLTNTQACVLRLYMTNPSHRQCENLKNSISNY